MTRLGALVRGGVERVVGTLAMDLLWYPSGLLIRTRPLPQTGIGGKNDHVVDQLGLTYCRKDGLVGVLPAPATLPCFRGLLARHHPLTNRTRGNRAACQSKSSALLWKGAVAVSDRSADSDFLRPGSPGRGSGVSMATISARVRHDHVEHAVITPTNHPMLRVHRK